MPRNAVNTTPTTTSFRILSAFYVSISGQFAAAFLAAQCYISDHPSPHSSELTTSAILTLQAFLQLKYQWIHDPSQSPFATHPIAMRVAVATSALHYLACSAALSFPPLHRLAHHLIVSSGYAAVAALLSIFLPDSAALCVYVVFGLLSAAELLLWMRRKLIEEEEDEAEVWIRRWRIRIRSFFNNLYGDFGDFVGQRIRRLPV
ncbi:hypothetical protein SASPL_147485 [Salvia splendens]|uniref:Transmembrane protein n=1 Tax=Salvia splendens TaxID=180675 RepID=A0A8X8WFQ0_SALSN|nr:hypothetical protein SASPL_147485 [Salvia splendens]